jgi:hypothetical protein
LVSQVRLDLTASVVLKVAIVELSFGEEVHQKIVATDRRLQNVSEYFEKSLEVGVILLSEIEWELNAPGY